MTEGITVEYFEEQSDGFRDCFDEGRAEGPVEGMNDDHSLGLCDRFDEGQLVGLPAGDIDGMPKEGSFEG